MYCFCEVHTYEYYLTNYPLSLSWPGCLTFPTSLVTKYFHFLLDIVLFLCVSHNCKTISFSYCCKDLPSGLLSNTTWQLHRSLYCRWTLQCLDQRNLWFCYSVIPPLNPFRITSLRMCWYNNIFSIFYSYLCRIQTLSSSRKPTFHLRITS